MRLFRYLPPYKGLIIGAGLAMIAGGGASSLIALVLGKLTDMGFYEHNKMVAVWAPVALIGISILHGGTQYGGGASSLIALVLGKLTDMGFYEHNKMVAVWAPVALIGISILHGGTQYLSSFLLVRVSQSLLLEIRTTMFERVLSWGEPSYMAHRCGEVQSKFINEASTALGTAANVMTTIIRDSIQIICLISVL